MAQQPNQSESSNEELPQPGAGQEPDQGGERQQEQENAEDEDDGIPGAEVEQDRAIVGSQQGGVQGTPDQER